MLITNDIFTEELRFLPKELVFICDYNRIRMPSSLGFHTEGIILESLDLPKETINYSYIPNMHTTIKIGGNKTYSNLILHFTLNKMEYDLGKTIVMDRLNKNSFKITLEELNPMNDIIYLKEFYGCNVSSVDWLYEDTTFRFKLEISVGYTSSII